MEALFKLAEGKQADWDRGIENNQDPYGMGVYRYANAWGQAMETAMAGGETVEQCAKRTSHEADSEGITGFMHGAAVSILSDGWIHGEELRLWHNIDTQIGNEGEKANESGRVLNPAIVNISKD